MLAISPEPSSVVARTTGNLIALVLLLTEWSESFILIELSFVTLFVYRPQVYHKTTINDTG